MNIRLSKTNASNSEHCWKKRPCTGETDFKTQNGISGPPARAMCARACICWGGWRTIPFKCACGVHVRSFGHCAKLQVCQRLSSLSYGTVSRWGIKRSEGNCYPPVPNRWGLIHLLRCISVSFFPLAVLPFGFTDTAPMITDWLHNLAKLTKISAQFPCQSLKWTTIKHISLQNHVNK